MRTLKTIVWVSLIFYFTALSYASPFLVCDPQADALEYVVVLSDGAEIITPAPLHYDLSGLTPGVYVVTVYAKSGVWRSEASIPLDFTKPLLLQPVIKLAE